MKQKIWKKEYLESVRYEALEGTINDAITYLAELTDKYEGRGYRNYKLETEYDYDDSSLALTCQREETDKELKRREKAALTRAKAKEKAESNQEKQEKKLLARLTKKYGVDSSIIE